MMCVTTNSAVLVIAWTVVSMYFSGLSVYWLLVTLPVCRFQEYLTAAIYPMSAALVVVLLLSPMFAVAGDLRLSSFRLRVGNVIGPLGIFGLVSVALLTVTFVVIGAIVISYFVLIGYLLLLVAGGVFQANAIQLGRNALGNVNSPERSAFVHWYYWATYIPTFAAALIIGAEYWSSSQVTYVLLSVVLLVSMIAFSASLLIICAVCYSCSKRRGGSAKLPPVVVNPVKQICRVTRLALRSPPKPGLDCGFLDRLNQTRQSLGGLADDEEVDNVTNFWLLLALMASLYGFFLWDDMWAMPFTNAVIDNTNSIPWGLSSQATTSVIVFIAVPVYQITIRPLLGKHSPPLLGRILVGLILQIISLSTVTWSSIATTLQLGSDVLSDVCNFNFKGNIYTDGYYAGEGIDCFILIIPQVINGFSQLLVFPAVIELILSDAPLVMQGLLIGLWYAMQSIHILMGVLETVTCAVYYWPYYIVKIILVLASSIAFVITAFFYKHNQVVPIKCWPTPSAVNICY